MAREGHRAPGHGAVGTGLEEQGVGDLAPVAGAKLWGPAVRFFVFLVLLIARDAVAPPGEVVVKTTARDGKHGGLCPSCPHPGTGRP